MPIGINTPKSYARFCGVTVLLLFVLAFSEAQITIPSTGFSNLLTVGKTFTFYNAQGSMANIGKRGGPSTYDFNGLQFQEIGLSNVYSIGTIPKLAARFPSNGISIGITPDSIESNPVFLFGTDTLFVLGEATLIPPLRFRHNRPYEPVAVFPVTYPTTRTYTHMHYDTSYNLQGAPSSINVFGGSDSVTVDGYGTLKILGRQFECLRMKLNHYTFSDKEFMFMTREGVLFDVMMSSSQRDTGLVQLTGARLLVPSAVTGVEDQRLLAASYGLDQNYPNPFNPTTAISYQLLAISDVRLRVFDLLGREIATLVNEVKSAGRYTVQWDASGSPSGIYFYQLTAGKFSETKKMVLMK